MSGIATRRSIGGFKAGALYILAARPGMGARSRSTSLKMSRAQEPVAFFSLEMPSVSSPEQLLLRRLALRPEHRGGARHSRGALASKTRSRGSDSSSF